ncbi:trypsin-like peptidase domain-containing protein [Yoonia sp. BS5-3]|uniref:Trypsin-like peptidase domain-containing protein n=1 Tax=Yoonia phaeophyticola TaxID=3137369 RepID=A0ABZ2UZ98_9RHOB
MFKAIATIIMLVVSTLSAHAQDNFWVQIEAQQTLRSAQDRARDYARRLDDIHGYYIDDGFYGIFIGPYNEEDAQAALQRLLAQGAIPRDSFVYNGRWLRQQFWPIGGGAPTPATVPDAAPAEEPVAPPPASTPDISALPADPPLIASDETLDEARASEAALERGEKEELQKALQWAGYYTAAIDGSFGGGTRRAMQAWQDANNMEPTGVLTTRQRELLIRQYNQVLRGLNLRLVRDNASGIQMDIPTDVVAFSEYRPPFVRFEASGDIDDALVLFISQLGDEGRLIGLYEVMQVLQIIPPQGPREINADGFVIEGIGNGIHSYTSVTLVDGEIKGFTLVWPEGDEARRSRMLAVMQDSFERLPGTLDPSIVPATEDQAIDMVAGLAVRQPRLSRSGFYVDDAGTVVTTPEVLDSCTDLTFDRETDAEVVASDPDLGIAVLRPVEALAPIGIAAFQTALPRLQDQVAVAGYPFNGVLSAPTLTFGQVVDIRGLTGNEDIKRLSILPQPSDAGGPVFDQSGAVLGMLLPRQDGNTRVLPPEVNFSVDASEIVDFLEAQEITARTVGVSPAISPVALTRRAADITVLVSCW